MSESNPEIEVRTKILEALRDASGRVTFDLPKEVEIIKEMVAESYRRGESWSPTAFVFGRCWPWGAPPPHGEVVAVMISMSMCLDEPDLAAERLRTVAGGVGALAVVFAAETWLAELPEGETAEGSQERYGRVRDIPGRREAAVVNVEREDGTSFAWYAFVSRESEHVTIGEWTRADDTTGNMTHFIPASGQA